MWIPNSVCNWTNMQRILNPNFKVALPGNMEKISRCPKKNNCKLSKMRGKNLLIKTLFSHFVMTFKIMGCSNTKPQTTCRWILSQSLTKSWKFCYHRNKKF
eukprot:gnl/TRDRNA2_/TRDRNA2_173375_c0_seq3.p5 gnl/TRDRNA2_/TRDRNA2_173375_c0~~gnl/TRDRNA2_/TRDRNA2_173375_c0_seq3.p5  ORF type:complete len:101 (-),score=5.83 gnl/TRDRNA2_/TRDRNA2_173375_c0_seq3:980-1282(-)